MSLGIPKIKTEPLTATMFFDLEKFFQIVESQWGGKRLSASQIAKISPLASKHPLFLAGPIPWIFSLTTRAPNFLLFGRFYRWSYYQQR